MSAIDTPTIAAVAAEAREWFTTTTRGDDRITILKDGAPDWVRDVVYAAHDTGACLPDDWRYAACASAVDAIADTDAETRDDLDDAGFDWADGNVDVYTGARLAWLASRLDRADYCDSAQDEGLTAPDTGMLDRIGIGQYLESREVFELVASALESERESRDAV